MASDRQADSTGTEESPTVVLLACRLFLGLLLACVAGCHLGARRSLSKIQPTPISVSTNAPLKIAIVGSGVLIDRDNELGPRRNEMGWAMKNGAEAAFLKSPQCANLREVVSLQLFDDHGNTELAKQIAKQIRSDPNYIAVVGHASSGMSRACYPIYRQAQIPLLLPIATSPKVTELLPPEGGTETCFRLPPNDIDAQVPAVMALLDELNREKPFIVQDESREGEALQYSEPICSALRDKLGLPPHASYPVAFEKSNCSHAASAARAYKADAIVFCGYASTSPSLFQALNREYSEGDRPIVIMTDGCRDALLDTQGFESYLMFPVQPVSEDLSKTSADKKIVAEITRRDPVQSYQPFGYDAILILANAFKACGNNVTRSRLLEQLRGKKFIGTECEYRFVDGENQQSFYYSYSCKQQGNGLAFIPHLQFDHGKSFPISQQ